MVENGHCSHRLDNGYGSWQYARIVTSAGCQRGGISLEVDGVLLLQQGGYGLEGHAEVDVLAVADAALDAAAVVGGCGHLAIDGAEDIVLLGATGCDAREALAIFEALDGVDAEHGCAEGGVELAELWLAEACRTALDDAGDDAADGVAFGLHLGDELLHLGCLLRIGTAHGIALCQREVVETVVALEGDVADLRGVGLNADAQLAECQLGECSAYTAADGDAGRGASAATMVAYTVFLMIGVVGMGGTEQAAHVLVVLRVLVGVPDDEADGTASGLAFEDAAEQLHLVGLVARGGDLALSWATAVQLALDEVHVDVDACGHAVYDAADGFAVALTKGCQPEYGSETIHDSQLTIH